MKCSNCGNECNDNAKFCENCGSKISIEEKSNIDTKKQETTMPATDRKETFEDEQQKKAELTFKEKLISFLYKYKKPIQIIGIILFAICFLFFAFIFLGFILTLDEELHPSGSVLPLIDFAVIMVGSIFGIITCLKYDKKYLKTTICLFLISLILYPISEVVYSKLQNQDLKNQTSIIQQDETTTELITETTTEPTTVDTEYLKKQEKEFKQSCKTYSYKTLEREPDKYKEEHVKFTGEVIQAIDSDFMCQYRINVTKSEYGNYTDTIYVTYFPKDDDKKILEDDIVTFYGYFDGMYTYQSAIGATVTVPKVSAEYIQIDKMAE